MTIVVDANVVATLATAGDLGWVESRSAVAPSLMWSEAVSGVRQARWRGEIDERTEERAVELILAAHIGRRTSDDLYRRAVGVARAFGWAKTYDAEYVALAQLERAPLLTLDGRLRRRVAATVPVVDPADILA